MKQPFLTSYSTRNFGYILVFAVAFLVVGCKDGNELGICTLEVEQVGADVVNIVHETYNDVTRSQCEDMCSDRGDAHV